MKLYSMLCLGVISALMVTAGALRAQEGGKRADKKDGHEVIDRKDAPKKDDAKGGADRAEMMAQRFSYPLTTCPVSGEKLGPKATEFVVKGHLVRTCCGDCKAEIEKDPAAALKKIEDGVVAAQKAGYPLSTCAVSGAKLDDKAVDYVFGTRLVRLANREAVAAFEKDPKTAMSKVDEAYVKAQEASYPLAKCLVSGHEFKKDALPVNKLYGTTLVRFCCKDCIADFEKDSDKFLKQLADARKPAK